MSNATHETASESERPADGPLDHTNPTHLEWAYEEFDTITRAAEEFEVSYQSVYNRLREHGIHYADKSHLFDWLSRPADEIVETSAIDASLDEVLTAATIIHDDPIGQMRRQLGMPPRETLYDVLWELGFREQEAYRLLPVDTRRERASRLREVFCDD